MWTNQPRSLPRPGDRSSIPRYTDITLILLSSIFIMARLYVRKFITRSLGLDDCAAIISLGFLAAMVSMELIEVKHGMGRHIMDVDDKTLRLFFAVILRYVFIWLNASFFIRLSVLLFIRRLLPTWRSSTPLWITVAVFTVQHLIIFFFTLFQCSPVRALWVLNIPRKCIGVSNVRRIVFVQAGVGIGCDIALFLVPVTFMWRNLSTGQMRYRVTILLGFGLFTCVAGIIRFVTILMHVVTPDPTWIVVDSAMWTQLECHIGLITSCFPAINHVFRKLVVGGDISTGNSVRMLHVPPGIFEIDTSMEQGFENDDIESGGVILAEVDSQVVVVLVHDVVNREEIL